MSQSVIYIIRNSCQLIVPVAIISMMFLWTGDDELPSKISIIFNSHRAPVKLPAVILESTHVTSHSKPTLCSDRSNCHYYTSHRENTAPGKYFNYVFHHKRSPPPIPVLGVTAISPDWVGRLIDSIDHPVTRLVVVQNGESNSTNTVIKNAIKKYKRRFHGAGVNYIYFKTNQGCGAGFNSILRFAAPEKPSVPGYELSRASYCLEGERGSGNITPPQRNSTKEGIHPIKNKCDGVDTPGAWALVLNDDIAFRPGDLAHLSSAVAAHTRQFSQPGHGFLSFKYTFTDSALREDWVYRPPFCAFVLTSKALAKWGLFDENLWPAFKEDNEFCIRMGAGEKGIANCLMGDVIDQGVRLIHGNSDAAVYNSGQSLDGGLYATHRAVQIVGFVCGDRYLKRKWGNAEVGDGSHPTGPNFVPGTGPAWANGAVVASGELFDWAIDDERLDRMKAAFDLIKAHIEEDHSRCTDTENGECARVFLGDSVC